jgi:hypothetical protein
MNTILSLIFLLSQSRFGKDWVTVISDYIIENLEAIASMSAMELSEKTHVSNNTLIKYCRMIGCDTFSDFKKDLANTILIRKAQIEQRYAKVDQKQIYEALRVLCIQPNLPLLQEQIEESAGHIVKEGSLHIYGATYPLALSQEFAEDLSVCGIPVYIHQNTADLSNVASQAHPVKGAGLILTFSGRWAEYEKGKFDQLCQALQTGLLCSEQNLSPSMCSMQMPAPIAEQYSSQVYLFILNLLFLEIKKRLTN